jgi:pimeloyl-ACP methyl ester carboxylesterase
MNGFTAFSMLMLLLVVAPSRNIQETRIAQEGTTKPLSRAVLDGIELEYEVRGAGEPVILAHAGVFAEWFKPLMNEPALTGRYRIVRYHRAGYAGSSRVAGRVSIADQAAHLRALMRHLGIERAHIVGHSSSGNIALQLALDAPHVVRSLALLEPALLIVPSPPQVPQALGLYRAGDKAGAVDTFLRGTCGLDYRVVLEKAVPGAFDQAVANADTFFGQELPALREWSFGLEEARRITQPVLAVLGAKSGPIFRQRQELLLTWLPKAEAFILPDAAHLMHVQNPRGVAEGLAAFFTRHPISVK